MKILLPASNYKIVAIGIICIGFIVATVIITDQEKNVAQEAVTALVSAKAIQEKDTDKDGLPDWEEAMWKTDPQNQDTDGDGVYDGVEVMLGYSPTIKGQGINAMASTTETFDPNATNRLATNFVSELAKIRNINGSISDADTEKLVRKMLQESSLVNEPLYSITNLKISSDNSVTSMRKYGNNTATAISKDPDTNQQSTKEIVAEALSTQDGTILKKLDPLIADYTTAIQKLLAVSVPKEAVTIHLSLINNLNNLKTDIIALKGVFEDPVTAILRIEYYKNDANKLAEVLHSYPKFFSRYGIVYSDQEIGSILK